MGELSFSGVVFDVDGVLFDTERLHRSVWAEVAPKFNCAHVVDHYLEFVGRTRADGKVLITQLTHPDFPVDEFFEHTTRRCLERMAEEGVPVKPGVREVLDLLTRRGIPIALATSTYRERTLMRLEAAGLTGYFRSVTTGDQVTHGKPDPEIYLTACRALGTDPARTLAVEDSRNGILAAHAAGMNVVMVPDLVPCTPDLEALLFGKFASLLELRDYLEQHL